MTNRIPLVRNKAVSPHLAKCDYFTVDKLNLDGRMLKKAGGFLRALFGRGGEWDYRLRRRGGGF